MTIGMAPGTAVSIGTAATPNAVPSTIGTFFAVGQAAQGPVGVAEQITSLSQYVNLYGSRTQNSVSQTLYDAIDTFFQEGGQVAYVSRVFAAAGVTTDTATLTLNDRAGTPLPTLKISANGPGVWGNSIQVQVTAGTLPNTYVLNITCPGYSPQVSPNLSVPFDAVAWASSFSSLVTIAIITDATPAPNNNPAVVAATSLAGGTDNVAPANADWTAALTAFVSDLGIGQVAAPGQTVTAIYTALLTHAQNFNRFALLDAQDGLAATAAEAVATGIQGTTGIDPSYGMLLLPNVIYPGLPTNTATPPFGRYIPPSGAVAGVMASVASAGNNADVAAAGLNGVLDHAIGVTTRYVDSDRAALDPAGVAVIRSYRGLVQLYGYTSLSINPAWTDVGNCRLRMQIIDGVRQIGDSFVFSDIDAQGHTAAAFGGQVNGYLNELYLQGALFGATATDAFFVNVGPSVNTPTTASERELLASVGVRMSPTAEFVNINVTKYPVSQTLPST